ncbi:MAG: hypothetical protein NVS4B3_06950 [Gemmatimonadaceae bacterium]
MIRKTVATLFSLSVLASCGGGGYDSATAPLPTPPPPSTSKTVNVADNFYSPSANVVPVGTTVTWTWIGAVQHDVVFDDGQKSVLQQTGTYSRQFPAAGAYSYHCTVHGLAMSGKVTVQ